MVGLKWGTSAYDTARVQFSVQRERSDLERARSRPPSYLRRRRRSSRRICSFLASFTSPSAPPRMKKSWKNKSLVTTRFWITKFVEKSEEVWMWTSVGQASADVSNADITEGCPVRVKMRLHRTATTFLRRPNHHQRPRLVRRLGFESPPLRQWMTTHFRTRHVWNIVRKMPMFYIFSDLSFFKLLFRFPHR